MLRPIPLVILGAATALLEVSELVAAINAQAEQFEIRGALDDDAALHGKTIGGVQVLGGLPLAAAMTDARFVFAISSYNLRLRRIEILRALGLEAHRFVNLIHPRADVSPNAVIGRGVTIYSHAFVATQARLGNFTIVYNSAVISPYSELDDFAMVAGLAFLGARTRLGTGAFAGGNSSVAAGVSIGAGGMLGTASAAYRDIPPGIFMLGNPAKPVTSIPVPPELLAPQAL